MQNVLMCNAPRDSGTSTDTSAGTSSDTSAGTSTDTATTAAVVANRKRKALNGRAYKTQIRILEVQNKQAKLEITNLKIALALSNQTLVEAGIHIPEKARIFASIVGDTSAGARPGPAILPHRIGADCKVGDEECPYSIQMVNLPDTSCLTNPHKFLSCNGAFPHAIDNYSRTHELAAHVEAKPLLMEFKLTHRTRPNVACDERNLQPGVSCPRILFKLWLVYADTGEKVTLGSLDNSSDKLRELCTPNIIGSEVAMVGGMLTFKIQKLLAYSTATRSPKHRKFRFEVECVDEYLKAYRHMHGKTIDFYSKARIRIEKPRRKNKAAN